jgi:hypothetical protein
MCLVWVNKLVGLKLGGQSHFFIARIIPDFAQLELIPPGGHVGFVSGRMGLGKLNIG